MIEKVQNIIRHLYGIYSRDEAFSDVSLFKGICGDALLHHELYEWSGDILYKERCSESIDRLLEQISSCTELNFANGFAGVCYAISYLSGKGVIEVSEDIFEEVDTYIGNFVQTATMMRNYDLQCGLIGAGIYYIERNRKYDDCAGAVYDIIGKLLSLAENKNDDYYWRYYIEEFEGARGELVNTGLLHGMTSILFFLMICIKEGYCIDGIRESIVGGLKFLENNTAHGGQYTWNNSVHLHKIRSVSKGTALGFCYGDLGIANTFMYAASCFENDHYLEIGLGSCERLVSRIASFEVKNDDLLYFCHGIAGLIYFANVFRHTANREVWDGVLYGLLDKLENYINSRERLPPGMLDGAYGILLSLLSITTPTFIGRILLLN